MKIMNKDEILDRLSKYKFRSSFKLKDKDIEYINDLGLDKVRSHAYDFINKRLRDISNINDGKQTPMRGHPVFISEHATATCCRGCLEKWYHIDKNKVLSDKEVDFIVDIIMEWIKRNMKQKYFFLNITKLLLNSHVLVIQNRYN